jgi:hypothetical protein
MPEAPAELSRSKEGWLKPLPERVPKPTYQPAVMSLGITFILFGLVSSYAFCAAGGGLFALSLMNWIGELVHGD